MIGSQLIDHVVEREDTECEDNDWSRVHRGGVYVCVGTGQSVEWIVYMCIHMCVYVRVHVSMPASAYAPVRCHDDP